jgi:hypothetical protein
MVRVDGHGALGYGPAANSRSMVRQRRGHELSMLPVVSVVSSRRTERPRASRATQSI